MLNFSTLQKLYFNVKEKHCNTTCYKRNDNEVVILIIYEQYLIKDKVIILR